MQGPDIHMRIPLTPVTLEDRDLDTPILDRVRNLIKEVQDGGHGVTIVNLDVTVRTVL